jgi:DNA polymerase-3 subunit gamma/tau
MMAAEMAVIRLTHVSELPSPEEIMRRLDAAPQPPAGGGGGAGGGAGVGAARGGTVHGAPVRAPAHAPVHGAPVASGAGGAHGRAGLTVVAGGGAAARVQAPEPAPQPQPELEADPAVAAALASLSTFDAVLDLIRERRDARLLVEVESGLRLVSYAPGRIAFQPSDRAPRTLAADLAQRLQAWTGQRWVISVENGPAAPTVVEARDAARADLHDSLRQHPLVKAALAAFPGAEIRATRELLAADPGIAGDNGVTEDPWDDWEPVDPFDDEPI